MSALEHDLAELVRQVVREELDAALRDLVARLESRPPARYLTMAEAAKVAGVGLRVIQQAVTDGALASITRGRSRRVTTDAIDAWLESA